MFEHFKEIKDKIKNLNLKIEGYRKDSVIQSLPSVAYVNRAKKLIEQNKLTEALEILAEAEALPQDDALVFKYKGIVYDKLSRFEEAVAAYKKSANLNCHDKIIWQKLGFALVNSGKYDEAAEIFENADKITPSNADVNVGWGMAFMKQGNYKEAHEKFVNASKINRYNFTAIFLAAVMEIRLNLLDEAELKLNFLANVCPNETNTYEYANLKFIKKDYDNALFYAQKALSFNPHMLPVYLLLGKIFRVKLEKEKSIDCYKNAEELSLVNSNLYLEWALTLLKFEDYTEAKEKLSTAEGFGCNTSELSAALALCNIHLGDAVSTKKVLEDILKEEPQNSLALTGLGLIACVNENYKEGIRYFKDSLDADETGDLNYYYIAEGYLSLDDDTHTKEYFEKSITANPKRLKTYIDYARYLGSKGWYADAGRKLRKAFKLDENNLEILNLMFFINYILVKEQVCEYNIKETLRLAEKIEKLDNNAFKYPDERAELTQMLKNLQEKEKN